MNSFERKPFILGLDIQHDNIRNLKNNTRRASYLTCIYVILSDLQLRPSKFMKLHYMISIS